MRKDGFPSVIRTQDFYSPGPPSSPVAPRTNSREEATYSNLETNLSCPFPGVALKIHFLQCSATTGCAWVGGGLGGQDLLNAPALVHIARG